MCDVESFDDTNHSYTRYQESASIVKVSLKVFKVSLTSVRVSFKPVEMLLKFRVSLSQANLLMLSKVCDVLSMIIDFILKWIKELCAVVGCCIHPWCEVGGMASRGLAGSKVGHIQTCPTASEHSPN